MSILRYTNWSGLLNDGVNDFLMQDSELSASKNVWSYKIGRLEKVPGYTKTSSSQVIDNQSVRFLHWHYNVSNTTDYFYAVSDTGSDLTVKYIAPGAATPVTSWTALTGISTTLNTYATSKLDMESYLGKTFVVGHKTGSTFVPNFTISGVTFNASDSDITSMPQGKYIVRYRDLLYVLNVRTSATNYPSRAYYSDEPTDDEIGWTGLLTNFVEFGYDDGDEITGAAVALDRLIVFKHRSMWRYDESERKQIDEIGCDSYQSIATVNNVLYWFNRYGFWRWAGGQPELISERAKRYIDAIDQTKLDEVVATTYGGFEYRAFIGTVVVDGITYTNAWFCWDTRREKCYIRCTYHPGKSAGNFVVADKRRACFGDNDGYVYTLAEKVDNVYSDDGQDIDSFFITRRMDYGIPENVKMTNGVMLYTKHGQGLKVVIEADDRSVFGDSTGRTIRKDIDDIEISASGHRFRYKFMEKSTNKSWEFDGFMLNTDIKEEVL